MAFWKKNNDRKDKCNRFFGKFDAFRPNFCKLACESLETRNLLSCSPLGSVEPIYGPVPAPYEVLHRPVSDIEVSPEIIAIPDLVEVSSSLESAPEISPVMGPMPVYFSMPLSPYSSSIAEEDLAQTSFQESSDVSDGVRIVDRNELETLTPAFYVDGIAYYSFSDVLAQGGLGTRRVVFSDSSSDADQTSDDAVVIPYDANDSSDDDLPQRSGGGDPEVWNLSLTVDSQHADSGLSTSVTPNAMIERLGLDVNASNPLTEANYVTITAPALPSDYVSKVFFTGSATLGTDYAIYGSLLNVMSFASDGSVEYSGGPLDLLVAPLNDAIDESAEFLTATLGVPYVPGSGGPIHPATFTYGTTSVTATVIDDDNWNLVAEQLDDEGEPIPAAGSSEIMIQEPDDPEQGVAPTLFRVSRHNEGDCPDGDLSYPISVTLGVGGSAVASGNNSDFSLWSFNGALSSILNPIVSTLGTLFTIVIPAGIESFTLAILPSFDGIVESLFETLEISVLSAVSPDQTCSYSVDDTEINYAIVDSDVFTLEEISFLNNLNLISDTPGSFDVSWQTGPHWKRNLPAFTKPIAYSSGSSMGVSASITGERDSNLVYEIKSIDSLGGETQWVQLSGDNLTLWFTETFSELLGGSRAYYDPNYSLTWSFRVNGGDARSFDLGSNFPKTTLYVTYNAPVSGTKLYHTVVHHSCDAASGATLEIIEPDDSEEQVQNKLNANNDSIYSCICTKFASLNVEKVNWIDGDVVLGDSLTYYGKDVEISSCYDSIKNILSYTYQDGHNTIDQFPSLAREWCYGEIDTSTKTSGLLLLGDGVCDAWQLFFKDVLKSQGFDGVSRVSIRVDETHVPNASTYNAHFKVKADTPGQGNIIPRENTWRGHSIVKYQNHYFDPSYGIHYGVADAEHLDNIKQSFLNNISSVGHTVSSAYAGYGWRYIPEFDEGELSASLIKIVNPLQ